MLEIDDDAGSTRDSREPPLCESGIGSAPRNTNARQRFRFVADVGAVAEEEEVEDDEEGDEDGDEAAKRVGRADSCSSSSNTPFRRAICLLSSIVSDPLAETNIYVLQDERKRAKPSPHLSLVPFERDQLRA